MLNSCVCLTDALNCLFARFHAPQSVPLFSYGRSLWITYSDLRQFIRELAKRCDLNPNEYGCHSLRSGGATFASAVGGSDYHIKLQGLWKSDAYLRYLHLSLEQRWALSMSMASAASSI